MNKKQVTCVGNGVKEGYEAQTFKVVNTHRFSHFEKPQELEDMEVYRKNRSPFDFSKENRRAASRGEYVAPKIGCKDPSLTNRALNGKAHSESAS